MGEGDCKRSGHVTGPRVDPGSDARTAVTRLAEAPVWFDGIGQLSLVYSGGKPVDIRLMACRELRAALGIK